jgi:hypothetical protein
MFIETAGRLIPFPYSQGHFIAAQLNSFFLDIIEQFFTDMPLAKKIFGSL